LLHGLDLIVRAHVREHGDLCLRLHGGGHLRQPGFEDVDAHGVRGAVVHVFVVFAAPGEGGTAAALQAIERDAFAAEQV
jgi:hypothetical protein